MRTIYDFVTHHINEIVEAIKLDRGLEGPNITPLMINAHRRSHNNRAKALKLIRERLQRIGLQDLMGPE